jgi:hypothetical protein
MPTVRRALRTDFDAAWRMLEQFGNTAMSREDFRRMLFDYPWPAEGDGRGWMLIEGEVVVGFIGAIDTRQRIAGAERSICTTTSWIVEEAHRSSSLMLLMPLLARRSHTIVNLTPSPAAYYIFRKLGFKVLEDTILYFPPMVQLDALGPAITSAVTWNPAEVRAALAGEDLVRFDHHQNTVARHILIRRDGRHCYAIVSRQRDPPWGANIYPQVHYIGGDPALFWENLALIQWASLRTLGLGKLMVESRFAVGYSLPPHGRRVLETPSLWRPATSDLAPTDVTGLYSELMLLKH